jgi:D-galactose 1-dehydrogenase
MNRIRLGIVGLGKIARDQHLPALAASADFELAGIASPEGELPSIPCRKSLAALLEVVPTLEAVALCTPPQVRYDTAQLALEQGLHVLLEKPPCVTVSEARELVEIARRNHVALFAAWHSRCAPAVAPARTWVAQHPLKSVAVVWKEDVRVWHPGQVWIWRAGGLGVFDPGINALSMLTHIVPGPLALRQAQLRFPSNCETPIAAHLLLHAAQGVSIDMELDFLHSGTQQWDMVFTAASGSCALSMGGSRMCVDGLISPLSQSAEYPALYAQFAALVRAQAIDCDVTPLELVADAFLCGQRTEVAPFVDEPAQIERP